MSEPSCNRKHLLSGHRHLKSSAAARMKSETVGVEDLAANLLAQHRRMRPINEMRLSGYSIRQVELLATSIEYESEKSATETTRNRPRRAPGNDQRGDQSGYTSGKKNAADEPSSKNLACEESINVVWSVVRNLDGFRDGEFEDWNGFGLHCRRSVATPNDPKLSDGRGWRDRCVVGGKAAAEAAGVTAAPVRCSAWLGVAVIC